MAAPLHDHRPDTAPDPVARFFALEPATVVAEPERPLLRVIPGGREAALRHRQPPSVYRARRLAVATVVLVVLLIGAVVLLVRVSSGAAAGDIPADAVAPSPVAGALGGMPDSVVVQPGDSLWSIAEELDPHGDIRPLVDELAQRAGPGVLEAGTRLDLRGLGR